MEINSNFTAPNQSIHKLNWQTILFRARDARRLSSSNHAQQVSPPPTSQPSAQALQQTTQSTSPSKQQVSIAPATTCSVQQQQQQQSGQYVVAANQQRALIKDHLDEETLHRLTVDTLEELDWCLDQLEAIQAHKSVGDLATSKFRRMLNKELSHFSESKSGSQISGYIRSFLGKYLSMFIFALAFAFVFTFTFVFTSIYNFRDGFTLGINGLSFESRLICIKQCVRKEPRMTI